MIQLPIDTGLRHSGMDYSQTLRDIVATRPSIVTQSRPLIATCTVQNFIQLVTYLAFSGLAVASSMR